MILLALAMLSVGVLHTAVPDHWAPIAVIARHRQWSAWRTARVAGIAGLGHSVSTWLIGIVFWIVGATVASRFGVYADYATSLGLIAFGLWMAIGAWLELRGRAGHAHAHENERGQERDPHHHHGEPIPLTDRISQRTAILLIAGSSPSIEALPVFFGAARFGAAFVLVVALIFAFSTIATYVALSVAAHRGLAVVRLGRFERYGEVLSGIVVAVLGVAYFAQRFIRHA
jgi:putative Mn2+ efflux pump MntP